MITQAETSIAIIIACTAVGLFYAVYHAYQLSLVKLQASNRTGDNFNQLQDDNEKSTNDQKVALLLEIGSYIERGANAFLFQEYIYIGLFVVFMAFVIFFAVEDQLGQMWTTVAFLLGCATSILSGFIGMRVAVFSNYRCTYQAQKSMTAGFIVAYRAGCVMGFCLTSLGLLVLTVLITIYTNLYLDDSTPYQQYTSMYEHIAGYGLGGSTIALFGRVGGGIFTKAADVGADLVGKIEEDLPEDSPSNPATIADNVGDNVGDIAGMGADLFGSFAESTVAALVVAATQPTFYYQPSAFFYPLLISAFGIIASLITTIFAFNRKTDTFAGVGNTLKQQLLVSTILASFTSWLAGYISLPDSLAGLVPGAQRQPFHAWVCTLAGLWSGMIIGFITEYYTSHTYGPVREVANSCTTGAATNIIYGLALGHLSTIIPVILLSITAFIAHSLLGMFGIALAALGMLSTLAVGLAIDGYGPVSDNAGGIAEMCELGHEVRERTDALDAAGNTTAAIGKGFAIGSAALVALSLYGAFITRAQNTTNKHPIGATGVNVDAPLIFSGLLIGAMLPYAFSAVTMKSVGKAALLMVEEIRKQLRENPDIKTGAARPNYERCVIIATKAAIYEMFTPAVIVLGTPLTVGVFFGPTAVAGLLPGVLVSGVCMAISSANSGGAWDNAKKFIEAGELVIDGEKKKKGSPEHKAAVVGDTVGDPLKDTSGPSLNILIKLSAIFSLIFVGFFDKSAYLLGTLIPESSI
jgi:H+-translocating diphosphatase